MNVRGIRDEHRLQRMRTLAVVVPLAYLAAIVLFVVIAPLPVWAKAALAIGVSFPLVALFAFFVFASFSAMRNEIALRERRFRGLLESAPDGIVIADADGRIVMVNRQIEVMLGYDPGELIGELVDLLLPESLRDVHVEHRADYYAHPGARPMGVGLELVARRKDGTVVPVEISLSPRQQEEGLLVTAIVRNIAERRKLEQERESLLHEAQMQHERQRIAMDLHDGIIQSIYAAALGLEGAADDIATRPDDTHAGIDRAIDALHGVIRDIRSYIFDLRPARVDADLRESLATMVNDFRVNSLVETTLEVPDDLPALDETRRAAVFHIVQEALNNVRKHARATEAAILLSVGDGTLRAEIRDNGVGFDPDRPVPLDHRGTRNMKARAEEVGGQLTVTSRPGSGSTVSLSLPVHANQMEEART